MQVHISYTGIKGQIAIDFVSDVAAGAVFCSTNGEKWTSNPSTSIHFGNIGYMHQSMCEFPATAGAKAFYRVASPTTNSSVFTIFPVPANGDAEVFAVWGDFGACARGALRVLLPRGGLPPRSFLPSYTLLSPPRLPVQG